MTRYAHSRGSGSGSQLISVRRPLPPPKCSFCCRSSIDMPITWLRHLGAVRGSREDFGFVAEEETDGAVPVRAGRVLAEYPLQLGPLVCRHLDRVPARRERVVGEPAHALERHRLVTHLRDGRTGDDRAVMREQHATRLAHLARKPFAAITLVHAGVLADEGELA